MANNAFVTDQQSAPQARYDNAYSLCMFAKGNEIPGYGPLAVFEPATTASVSLVQAIQVELNRLQYMQGPTNGVLGPQTVAAITFFEASERPACRWPALPSAAGQSAADAIADMKPGPGTGRVADAAG